jgi:Transposase DDE domain
MVDAGAIQNVGGRAPLTLRAVPTHLLLRLSYPPLAERFAKAPPAPENPTPLAAMSHRLQTPEGKQLYALRKQIPEPVFGIIKSVMGFRHFLLRGLDQVQGEWSLVTMAWNMKRMYALAAA